MSNRKGGLSYEHRVHDIDFSAVGLLLMLFSRGWLHALGEAIQQYSSELFAELCTTSLLTLHWMTAELSTG